MIGNNLWLLLEFLINTQIEKEEFNKAYETVENFIYIRIFALPTIKARLLAFERLKHILGRLDEKYRNL